MANIAVFTLSVSVSGNLVMVPTIAIPQNGSSPALHAIVATSNGSVTLTPPTGTLSVLIIPPSNSTITKTLKGVSGDTGIPLALATPLLIPLAASPGTFVITANGVENLDVYWL